MKINAKRILILLIPVAVGIQFIKPDYNFNTDLIETADIHLHESVPANISKIIKVSCYDCHSEETEHPWYNNFAPVNLWMAGHVRHGKGNFNYSNWGNYSTSEKIAHIENSRKVLNEGWMPPKSYKFAHEGAEITADEKQQFMAWLDQLEASTLSK